MKNALKCVFELLDLLENWENGTIFRKMVKIRKSAKKSPIHSLLTPGFQWGSVQKFWKFARLLSSIWAFRKTTWEVDLRDSIFLDRRFSQTVALKKCQVVDHFVWEGIAWQTVYNDLNRCKNGQSILCDTHLGPPSSWGSSMKLKRLLNNRKKVS